MPFKDTGKLQQREINFNMKLSSARYTIERAFALLKGRFRRLKGLDMARIDLIPQVIIACCVLHNVCIDLRDESEFESALTEFHVPEAVPNVSTADRKSGVAKRDRLANLLYVGK